MAKHRVRDGHLHSPLEPCHPLPLPARWRLGLSRFRRRWHDRSLAGLSPAHTGALQLSAVPSGESVQIQALQGGHMFLSRLACLGFTPGAHLKVVQNYGYGPLIVALRDTRIALGRGEAARIVVERLAGGDRAG